MTANGTLLLGALVRWSTRADGDVGRRSSQAAEARRRVWPGPWTTVEQVHGHSVAVIDRPLGDTDIEADGIVTTVVDVPIAVFGADCGLVALASPEGVVGVVHVGWHGVEEDAVGATVAQMRALGATRVVARTSAMIHPECYEFGIDALDRVAHAVGDTVRARTANGAPALDLPEAIATRLAGADVEHEGPLGGCTACEPGWYSHRARAEGERHALLIVRGAR